MEKFIAIKRSKDLKRLRYLIVDDSIFARKNLSRLVEAFGGHVVAEASDGLMAITEYDRIKTDIVLMDVTMPQMGGIEAVEKIVQQNPQASIVMVSGVGYCENIGGALQKRGRDFVQKAEKPQGLHAFRKKLRVRG